MRAPLWLEPYAALFLFGVRTQAYSAKKKPPAREAFFNQVT